MRDKPLILLRQRWVFRGVEFSTARSDFTAIGGTVNLAARLEGQAVAGEILLSPETAALVPALAAGAPVRSLILKGIAQPVPAQVLTAEP